MSCSVHAKRCINIPRSSIQPLGRRAALYDSRTDRHQRPLVAAQERICRHCQGPREVRHSDHAESDRSNNFGRKKYGQKLPLQQTNPNPTSTDTVSLSCELLAHMTAEVMQNFGGGRVVAISPHPESTCWSYFSFRPRARAFQIVTLHDLVRQL